jgi:hypothetical protein
MSIDTVYVMQVCSLHLNFNGFLMRSEDAEELFTKRNIRMFDNIRRSFELR